MQQLQAASLTAWVDGAAAVAAGIAIVNVRKRVLSFWFLPSGQIDQFVILSIIKDLGKRPKCLDLCFIKAKALCFVVKSKRLCDLHQH